MGDREMASLAFDDQVYNREVSFCKVYSKEDKEKLEELIKADAAYQTMLYAERKSKYVQSINRIDRRW